MNADRKKRIAHEISNWKNACNCRAVQLTGDRMAALLQELVDEPEDIATAELIGLPPVGELQIDAAQSAPKLSDERILEIYEEAKANWNAQADQCNQWRDLGVDEAVTLVARAIEREILGGAQA